MKTTYLISIYIIIFSTFFFTLAFGQVIKTPVKKPVITQQIARGAELFRNRPTQSFISFTNKTKFKAGTLL